MKTLLFGILLLMVCPPLHSQEGYNYDEAKVPVFTLPDPLVFSGGNRVRTAKAWEKRRRPQVLGMFEDQVYGKIPADLKMTGFRIVEESGNTPYKNGYRRQVEMALKKDNLELFVQLLIYLPEGKEKVPVFLGYNFLGNHSVTNDPEVRITGSWCRDNPSLGIINNQFTEQSRGAESDRWPVQMILDAGYGVATLYYGDVDPDRNDFSDGVHPFAYRPGQTHPEPNEWGAIAAWAWGLSRAADYLETDRNIDATKIVVIGHSRLGKTALWAGATDKRFAVVVSNDSGCGGAALSRRKFGETVKRINTSFPHWFCNNFKAYNDREENLPVDQHELIALIAPRPVYIASAQDDLWADPKGEYLSGYFASPVYRLYGKTGLESSVQPAVNQPVMNQIGYHIRTGKHDITDFDWKQYLHFADIHLFPPGKV